MKILAIDTSSRVLSIALAEDGSILKEKSQIVDRRHSALIVPRIREILQKNNLSIDDIDAFVVGLGPGSFTGLRIGLSTVKGFGIATKKPCIGIPSIDALALQVTKRDRLIVPIIDAKRSNLYSAIYKRQKDRVIKKSRHLLLNVDELMKNIKCPAIFLGDGIFLYKERIRELNKKVEFLGEDYCYPKADNLIRLALKKINRYNGMDLAKLRPIYLYSKDCQVSRKK